MVAQELAQEHTSGQDPGSHRQSCFRATALTLPLSHIGLGSLSETERHADPDTRLGSLVQVTLMPVSATPGGSSLTSYRSLFAGGSSPFPIIAPVDLESTPKEDGYSKKSFVGLWQCAD